VKIVQTFLHRRGVAGITLVQTIAMIPPLAIRFWVEGPAVFGLLIPALAIVFLWDTVFASLRSRPIALFGITTAVLFTILAPLDASLWQQFVVLSIGTALGELIFGGRGFAFLSAPVVALALWVLSFPSVPLAEPNPALSMAAVPGAALLLGMGLLSWRLMLSFLVVLLALAWFIQGSITLELALLPILALTFLIADPNAASATQLGRIVQGGLAAVLVVVFSPVADATMSSEALVFAALLASLAAPLIDQGAMAINLWQRRMRRA
jgi:Na+-transporting NADH:ubiquinone oxidoreductase subunit B